MLQPKGVALKFLAFFVAAKTGKTGLSVTCDVYDENDSLIVTGASATEIGGGWYRYVLAAGSNDANGEYKATFKTSDATVDAQHIPSLWVVPTWLDAIKAKTDTIGALTVTILSPIATDGTITLVRGDDYFAADGMSLDFVFLGLPYSFVGSTSVKLTLKNKATGAIVVFTGAVLSASSLRFEPTKVQTSLLVPNTNAGFGPNAYTYDVEVILANGHTETPGIGKANVREGIA